MNNKQDFINAGFSVVETENNENKLLKFLKEHYPSVIKDNEINLQELKAILGLPVDEKVNGYGLNFVGRNFARAKYAQKTDKELRFNPTLSKGVSAPLNAQSRSLSEVQSSLSEVQSSLSEVQSSLSEVQSSLSEVEMNTQNLIIKGDNLDVLKILKNYYSGKIKCIYIDPPYNTDSDEFVYPDKFDKEELEVLGLANLSEEDFARMEFSFKTKKSHNGWLSFMYPRLLLARDLLRDDGVIFISIDDNEQANLKLLCDEVFGEENFVCSFVRKSGVAPRQDAKYVATQHDYVLCYSKDIIKVQMNRKISSAKGFDFEDNYVAERGKYRLNKLDRGSIHYSEGLDYPIIAPDDSKIWPGGDPADKQWTWRWSKDKVEWGIKNGFIIFKKARNGQWAVYYKEYELVDNEGKPKERTNPYETFILEAYNEKGNVEVSNLFENRVFEYPKPADLIKHLLKIASDKNSIIMDFFAGSGTTGHAVMELNAEDGGNRKFILVQIDEPIKEDKPAYKFCIENNLPPVISSITIERLRRAGEKIKKEIEEENSKSGMFDEHKKKVPDIGFKVFDTVDAPKLSLDDDGLIQFPELNNDPLSRIYNMIFTVGLDEPTQVPKEVVKDCIYKIGNNYYITNSDKISKEDFAKVIDDSSKSGGKVFIDGWTASLNATLQHYKEDIKIVF